MGNVINEIIIDDNHPLFNTSGMEYLEFHSDYNQVRIFTFLVLQKLPEKYHTNRLLEQQFSEIIKNAIRHGNKGDIFKKVKIYYQSAQSLRFIVEDEGAGFQNIEEWNCFNKERVNAIETKDLEKMLTYVSYRTTASLESDGGNSLFAALDFWDSGLIYNKNRNKVAVAVAL